MWQFLSQSDKGFPSPKKFVHKLRFMQPWYGISSSSPCHADASSELDDDEPEGQAATAEAEDKSSTLEGLMEADCAVAANDGKNGHHNPQ